MKTAVLIDGSFFLKRYKAIYKNEYDRRPEIVAKNLFEGVFRALKKLNEKTITRELYRIYYYDCTPLNKRLQNPITRKGFDFGKSDDAIFRNGFYEELKKKRKLALRLGRVSDNGSWVINPTQTKALLNEKIKVSELRESDVYYDVTQKGVDMKIGLDIASLAYQKTVDQIILVSGDSDFVPAAKLARRAGIDFVLDSMGNRVNPDLYEHIDGMIAGWRPRRKTEKNCD